MMERRSFLSLFAGAIATGMPASKPPNIVIIFADDLGYGDLAAYGSKLSTPNLDRMAKEGVRLTQFYSANPVCSPSRAALLTGRYPTRVGVPRVLFPYDKTGLPSSEMTIAQMLKGKQYRTMCVGKWHLGHLPEFLPTQHGFDEYFGIPYSNDMSPRVLMHNTGIVEQEATLETLTQRYTEHAVRFIEQSGDKPFFLYMPHTFPHIPLAASQRFRGKSPLGLYGDVIAELDWSVGQVLDALNKTGVADNTLVIFTSDNGPWHQGSPGRLRGRKGSTYEGGVREPFIARFPGRIPSGSLQTAVAGTIDLLPTIAALCDVQKPQAKLDGIDIWPLLTGKRKSIDRSMLLYFDGWNVQCARQGKWKLHVSRYNTFAYNPSPAGGRQNLPLANPELYDMQADPDESYDIAAEHSDIVKQMQAELDRMLTGFPNEVQNAWKQTKAAQVAPTAAGSLPRAIAKPD